jgi:hypothetical protein
MGILDFWNKKNVPTPTKKQVRRPEIIDLSENVSANTELTKGLYHNTFPGMRLSGGLAFPIIALPVFFMGLPTPRHSNEKINEILNKLIEEFQTEMQNIHIQSHRDGTVWVWPKFDRITGKIIWEFFDDSIVTDIIRDISSGRIISIWTDEQISVKTDFNETKNIRRTRNFTESTVITKYIGAEGISDKIIDSVTRNPSGIMPIPFANNADSQEVRGHSDYERLIPDLKSYHDISLAEQEILAKFKSKMIFDVVDVNQWLENNGYGSISEIDLPSIDIIFNIKDKESVQFISSSSATEGHRIALERLFIKMVESSGVPEIVWGPSVSGNYASSADAMTSLSMYVADKQRQKNESYLMLWRSTLRLKLQSMLEQPVEEGIEIVWNDLDTVSSEVKSRIFQQFASGVSQLIASAGATLEQIYKLWKYQFPKATEEDFEKFKEGLAITAEHKQFSGASYSDSLSLGGKEPQEDLDKILNKNK